MPKIDLEKYSRDEEEIICWKCAKKIDKEDKYCRYCGAKQSKRSENKGILGIVLQFLVIGPFCLIGLWRSKNISNAKKKKYTYVIIGITMILLLGIMYALSIIMNYYNQILGI
ncbi:MAG: zinc ribbon domain-containing protein [Fusobacteriota bacterium]